jgi:hypothetical protein
MIADFHKKSVERNGLEIEAFLTGVRTFAGDFNHLYDTVFSGVSQKTPDRTKWEAFLKGPDASGFLGKLFQLTGIGKAYQPGDGVKDNPWIENPNMDAVQFMEKFDPTSGKLLINDGREFLPKQTTDPAFDRTDVYSKYTWLYERDFIGYQAYAYYLDINGAIIDSWDYEPDSRLTLSQDR